MPSIIGKTNSANSSEYSLAVKAVGIVAGLAAASVAGGFISPEHATQIQALTEQATNTITILVGVYAAGRSLIKAVIAYNSNQEDGQ